MENYNVLLVVLCCIITRWSNGFVANVPQQHDKFAELEHKLETEMAQLKSNLTANLSAHVRFLRSEMDTHVKETEMKMAHLKLELFANLTDQIRLGSKLETTINNEMLSRTNLENKLDEEIVLRFELAKNLTEEINLRSQLQISLINESLLSLTIDSNLTDKILLLTGNLNGERKLRLLVENNLNEEIRARTELEGKLEVEKQTREDLESRVNALKTDISQQVSSSTQKPAFLATLRQNINCNINQRITFEGVQLNVGKGYSPTTGMFTAPISGIYVFSSTLATGQQEQYHVAIVKSHPHTGIGYLFTDPSNIWLERSTTVLTHLNANEQVWMECVRLDNSKIKGEFANDYTMMHSFFSGFLKPSVYPAERRRIQCRIKRKLMSISVTMHFRRDLSEFVRIQQEKLALNKC